MYDRNPVKINFGVSYRKGLSNVECPLNICVCIKRSQDWSIKYGQGPWLEKFDLCFHTY